MIGLACFQISSTVFVCCNHHYKPEFPAYLHSVIGHNTNETPHMISLVISYSVQILVSGINRVILSQLEVLVFSFASSVRNSLKIILPSFEQKSAQIRVISTTNELGQGKIRERKSVV